MVHKKTGFKKESKYRQQLLNGFPNSEEARNAGVPNSPDTEDKLSGVLPKDFDKPDEGRLKPKADDVVS